MSILTRTIFTFLTFCYFSAPFLVQAGGKNLLENPGFEEAQEGWQFHAIEKEENFTTINSESARSGEAGMKVTDQSEKYGSSVASRKHIPVSAGDSLKLKFWVKVLEGNPNHMAVYVLFHDEQGNLLTKDTDGKHKKEFIVYLPGAFDEWIELSQKVKAPKNSSYVKLWIHSFSKPKITVYLDDFVLTKN